MTHGDAEERSVPFGPGTSGIEDYKRIEGLVPSNPDEAWRELLAVVGQTDDAGLFWVADILEDLVSAHRWTVVPRLEAELAENRRLREAFTDFVPLAGDDEALRDRLYKLREQIERDLERGGAPG